MYDTEALGFFCDKAEITNAFLSIEYTKNYSQGSGNVIHHVMPTLKYEITSFLSVY
jgi:hypothetical protein